MSTSFFWSYLCSSVCKQRSCCSLNTRGKTLLISCQLSNLRCYFGPRQTELMILKCRICSGPPGSLVVKKAPAVMMYWSHRYHKMQHTLFFFNLLFSGTEYHPQTMSSMLALNLLQIEIVFPFSRFPSFSYFVQWISNKAVKNACQLQFCLICKCYKKRSLKKIPRKTNNISRI